MMNKGITLIALIITIIVMLIIAGVSARLAVGNNSMISKAEIAKYENSITQIEQKLNEVYTQNYEEVESKNLGELKEDTPITKARALAYYLQDKLGDKNIFKKITVYNGASLTNHSFADDEFAYVSDEGQILYFLSPEALKKYDSTLEILELNEPSNRKSTNELNSLYAVTADLRVFVIQDGLDKLIGITKDDLSYYDFNSVIYKAGSDWANLFGEEEDITYQDGQAKKSFSIDFNSTKVSDDFDFSGIGELKHLSELTISNCNLGSIKGISASSETLTYLFIKNCNIENWTGIDQLVNLKTLIIQNVSQEQLNEILYTMRNTNYSKLSKLGIIGQDGWADYNQGVGWKAETKSVSDNRYCTKHNSNITSIGNATSNESKQKGLAGLTDETKKAVTTLLLADNSIKDLKALSGFNNLQYVRADSNQITSLEGLSNKPKLEVLRIANNNLGSLFNLEDGNNANDVTSIPNLLFLDVRNNKSLKGISGIEKMTKLKYLWFKSDSSFGNKDDSDTQISTDDLSKDNIKDFLIKLGNGLLIDSKLYANLVNESNSKSITRLELTGEIDDETFEQYKNCTNLVKLSINGITIKSKSKGNTLSAEETNKKINEVLSSLTKITNLQIINMNGNLTSTDFLSKMTKLNELDFRNNNATNLDDLANDNIPIKKLSINNTEINLKSEKMQKVINKLEYNRNYAYWTNGSGLLLCNDELYKQLKDCTDITNLVLDRHWQNQVATACSGIEIDLSECENLTTFVSYAVSAKFILPKSITSATIAQSGQNGIFNFKNCTKMTILNVYDSMNSTSLENTLRTIPRDNSLTELDIRSQTGANSTNNYSYLTECNLNNLKTLIISDGQTRLQNLSSLEHIAQLSSLEYIEITWAPNLKSLPDMKNLKKLNTLKINNCGLETIGDVGLQTLSNLTELNFNDNNLTNLYGLVVKDEKEDFPSLATLRLQNNNLENQFSMGVVTYNLQNKVFVPLHKRKLINLYLSGNSSFTDKAELKKLQWTNTSGIF